MEAEDRLFGGCGEGEAPPRTSPGVWGAAAPQPKVCPFHCPALYIASVATA